MELEIVIRIEFYRIIFLLNKCLNLCGCQPVKITFSLDAENAINIEGESFLFFSFN